jgi:hypothetical protein
MTVIKNINPESILIVTQKGALIRLKCPFKALSLINCEFIKENQICIVTHNIIAGSGTMYFSLKHTTFVYPYYNFEILLSYSH